MKPPTSSHPGPAGPPSRPFRASGSFHRAVFLVLALFGPLLLAGCGGPRPSLEAWPPGQPPPPPDAAQAESLATAVRRQSAALASLRGSGELLLRESPDARPHRLEVSLAVERAGRARMRGRFGILATVFDLRATSDSLELYFPRDGVLVSGALDRWKQSPFPGARQLIGILLPASPGPDAGAPDAWSASEEGWVLSEIDVDAAGDSLLRRQTYEPRGLRLVRQVLTPLGAGARPPVLITYDKHRWTGSGWLAAVVRVGSAGEAESLELRLTSSSLNGEIPGAVFRMDVPPDARRVSPEELSRGLLEETGEMEKQ